MILADTVGLASNHGLLSDWLLLIATVAFIAAGFLALTRDRYPDPNLARDALMSFGFALVAVALLVL